MADFFEKVIKINEQRIQIPSGTTFSDINEINSNSIDGMPSTEGEKNITFEDLQNTNLDGTDDSLTPPQEEVVVEEPSSDEGTEGQEASNDVSGDDGDSEEKTVASNTPTEATVDNSDSSGDTQPKSSTSIDSGDSLPTDNSQQQNGSEGKGSGNGQEQEEVVVDNLITQLEKTMSSDNDFLIVKNNKELITKWIKDIFESKQSS